MSGAPVCGHSGTGHQEVGGAAGRRSHGRHGVRARGARGPATRGVEWRSRARRLLEMPRAYLWGFGVAVRARAAGDTERTDARALLPGRYQTIKITTIK